MSTRPVYLQIVKIADRVDKIYAKMPLAPHPIAPNMYEGPDRPNARPRAVHKVQNLRQSVQRDTIELFSVGVAEPLLESGYLRVVVYLLPHCL